jgi:hypothetical protein
VSDEEENEEDIGIESIQNLVSTFTDNDSVLVLGRIASESDDQQDAYKVSTFNMDEEAMMNTAVVALTSIGQTIIRSRQEENKFSDYESMQTAAFFYGMQALSRTTSRWAKDIADQAEAGRAPKHVKETVEDSAASSDTPTGPRRTSGGDPIH